MKWILAIVVVSALSSVNGQNLAELKVGELESKHKHRHEPERKPDNVEAPVEAEELVQKPNKVNDAYVMSFDVPEKKDPNDILGPKVEAAVAVLREGADKENVEVAREVEPVKVESALANPEGKPGAPKKPSAKVEDSNDAKKESRTAVEEDMSSYSVEAPNDNVSRDKVEELESFKEETQEQHEPYAVVHPVAPENLNLGFEPALTETHPDKLDSNGLMVTTMVTGTDFLGNPLVTPSTFILEPERKAFQSCIFGCSSVTVSIPTDTQSTVIIILPLTIPCSLVSCPPCNSCVSSTVSITVCPVITTVTPTPATATIFTTAKSILNEKCSEMISMAVAKVAATSVITVTKTRVPVGCPAGLSLEAITRTVDSSFGCSTFVVCKPKNLYCPATALADASTASGIAELTGTHIVDTLQDLFLTSTISSIESTHQERTESQGIVSLIAQRMFQKNSSNRTLPSYLFSMCLLLLIILLA